MPRIYRNRRQAGKVLAQELKALDLENPVVLALPRGGVPVAAEIARELNAPLDVLLVRKLGFPLQPELGMGAIAERGVTVFNHRLMEDHAITPADLEPVRRQETTELERRARLYRSGREPIDLTDRVVVLVDDGLATGSTAQAGIESVRTGGAKLVVVAVPVGSDYALGKVAELADRVVCPNIPRSFRAVGEWYRDFRQVSDTEVIAILEDVETDQI